MQVHRKNIVYIYSIYLIYLVVSTPLKNISQIGSSSQLLGKKMFQTTNHFDPSQFGKFTPKYEDRNSSSSNVCLRYSRYSQGDMKNKRRILPIAAGIDMYQNWIHSKWDASWIFWQFALDCLPSLRDGTHRRIYSIHSNPQTDGKVSHHSLDWFKGKSTGNHGFYHQI